LQALFDHCYLLIHRRKVNPNGWGDTFHNRCACFPGNFKLLVRANGKFLICERGNDALEIGDVQRGLDGEKICAIYRAYHDLHAHECRRCWAMHLCGSCYAKDTSRTGTFPASLDPKSCEAERQAWTDKRRKYASVCEQNAGAFDYLNGRVIFEPRVPVIDFEGENSGSHLWRYNRLG
jgi:uncharacterized protein